MKPLMDKLPFEKSGSGRREFTILVADRNPHVRDFIRREMVSGGFRVEVAKNAEEVLRLVFQDESIDLIIIDPDVPGVPAKELLARLMDRIPGIPIVVHSLSPQEPSSADESVPMTFVRKEGESIDTLKKVVGEILADHNRPVRKEPLRPPSTGPTEMKRRAP